VQPSSTNLVFQRLIQDISSFDHPWLDVYFTVIKIGLVFQTKKSHFNGLFKMLGPSRTRGHVCFFGLMFLSWLIFQKNLPRCVAVFCSVLQCVATCCSVLQCVWSVKKISRNVLQYCSVLQCIVVLGVWVCGCMGVWVCEYDMHRRGRNKRHSQERANLRKRQHEMCMRF